METVDTSMDHEIDNLAMFDGQSVSVDRAPPSVDSAIHVGSYRLKLHRIDIHCRIFAQKRNLSTFSFYKFEFIHLCMFLTRSQAVARIADCTAKNCGGM